MTSTDKILHRAYDDYCNLYGVSLTYEQWLEQAGQSTNGKQ